MSESVVPHLGHSPPGASVTTSAARRAGPGDGPRGDARRVQPPPLPRHLRTTGVGWLIAARASPSSSTVLIFGDGVRGAAIPAIVVDDTVVRWMSDIDLPGIHGIARGVSYAALVVGHRDHELAAHRGADRLPAMASPGDLLGGVAAGAVRARRSCTT